MTQVDINWNHHSKWVWKMLGLPTFESANSAPAAPWQSCFFTVMNLAQGTSSCLPSDQSEKTCSGFISRCSSAWFTSSRWVKRFGEEVSSHTLGTPWQQLCQRPPRWSVDEMTTFLSALPEGKETERVVGEEGYRFHFMLKFGLCEGVWRHLYAPRHLHSICPLYWNELKRGWSRSTKYCIKAYLLRKRAAESRERKRGETYSMMDDREISIWAGGETSNYERGGTRSFIPRGALRASVRSLRDGQEVAPLPTTAHKPPQLLLPHAIAASMCCKLSHNQALLTASHQKDTNLNTPRHLLIYCLIKRLLVSFCVSKKSVLVFPPHSAPFIIDWCRETYSSYISCNWNGRGPKVSIDF